MKAFRIISLLLSLMPLNRLQEKQKNELEGEWVVVVAKANAEAGMFFGQVQAPEEFKTVTIESNRLKISIDGRTNVSTFRLNPAESPRWFDLTLKAGRLRHTTDRGIYKLEGDTLTLNIETLSVGRPTAFVAPPDGLEYLRDRTVVILRRKGADPKRDALDKDRAASARKLLGLAKTIEDQVLEERAYPAAAIYGKDGNPLLSWRVALLERTDEGLFKEFKLDEPWDGEHNKKLLPRMPARYAAPGLQAEAGMTFYRAFSGPGTMLQGRERLAYADALGSGPHMMIVEAAEPVPWTKPEVLSCEVPMPKLGRTDDPGFLATFADLGPEKVRFISKATPEKELRDMILRRRKP